MVRDTQKLEAMVQNNLTLQGRHEKRLKAFWLLKSRPRILTMPALLAALVAHNDDTGKEHSYAEKLEIVRQQIQLRKQLDRIHKMGDMKLQNHGQVGVEDPLELCVADFKVILQHEATHGIPKPLPPVLVKGRESLPGESALLKQLNKQQREAADALTRNSVKPTPSRMKQGSS
jgi:hypothetical protein